MPATTYLDTQVLPEPAKNYLARPANPRLCNAFPVHKATHHALPQLAFPNLPSRAPPNISTPKLSESRLTSQQLAKPAASMPCHYKQHRTLRYLATPHHASSISCRSGRETFRTDRLSPGDTHQHRCIVHRLQACCKCPPSCRFLLCHS